MSTSGIIWILSASRRILLKDYYKVVIKKNSFYNFPQCSICWNDSDGLLQGQSNRHIASFKEEISKVTSNLYVGYSYVNI